MCEKAAQTGPGAARPDASRCHTREVRAVDRYWPALLAQHTDVRDRLVEAYDGADRGYHDTRHLTEVLEHVERLLEHEHADRDAVLLAAWFHDAVYDEHGDNERRSAELAAEQLTGHVPTELVDEVARLVRVTAHHRPDQHDLNAQVLCDADLAILAADEQRYAEYVDGVRREYAYVDDLVFAAGRAAVLVDLLDKPTLFHTKYARQHWEARGRANVERELQQRRLP
jgi:predicted metal-dependent HD superfamily phosphohydrolase